MKKQFLWAIFMKIVKSQVKLDLVTNENQKILLICLTLFVYNFYYYILVEQYIFFIEKGVSGKKMTLQKLKESKNP